MSSSVTWDKTVVSRTTVRGGRCRSAKRHHVSDCNITTYSTPVSRVPPRNCQNGIDCRLYAFSRTLSDENGTLVLVVWRHPGIVSTPPVIDTTPAVVESRPTFLKSLTSMGPWGGSDHRPEASGRQLEALFRCQKALDRQTGIVNSETVSLQSPSRGFQSFAQTDQSITIFDQPSGRLSRQPRSARLRIRRAREPPSQFIWPLGRVFSRPLLETRSMMSA